MAHNHANLFKDKTFKSITKVDQAHFAILDATCMYIHLPIDSVVEELQKVAGESQGDPYLAKLLELVSNLNKKIMNDVGRNRIGLIYFKTDEKEVFPKLYVEYEFFDLILANLPSPVFHLEGKLRLEGGSSAPVASKSKSFHKSCILQERIKGLKLTSPFPLEIVQPIKDCQWILENFSLSVEWEDGSWLGGSLKSSSNQVLQNLFGSDSPPKDFILVAGNGTEIPFHGLIFAAKSPALAAMVNPSGAMKENDSKRIEMRAFSEESLKSFVSYIYCQPVPFKEMDCDTVLELFRLGHMYQLQELTKAGSKMMLHKGVDWFLPNCALELYFLVKNLTEFKNLANHTVDIMLKLGDTVRESERYQELDKDEANGLLLMLLKKSTSG